MVHGSHRWRCVHGSQKWRWLQWKLQIFWCSKVTLCLCLVSAINQSVISQVRLSSTSTPSGSSFLDKKICCLSLFFLTVNEEFGGFGTEEPGWQHCETYPNQSAKTTLTEQWSSAPCLENYRRSAFITPDLCPSSPVFPQLLTLCVLIPWTGYYLNGWLSWSVSVLVLIGTGQCLSLGAGLVWNGSVPWLGCRSAGSRAGKTLSGQTEGSAGSPWSCQVDSTGPKNNFNTSI